MIIISWTIFLFIITIVLIGAGVLWLVFALKLLLIFLAVLVAWKVAKWLLGLY